MDAIVREVGLKNNCKKYCTELLKLCSILCPCNSLYLIFMNILLVQSEMKFS